MNRASILLLAQLASTSAWGEPVRVRSGDHEGFTRLVFEGVATQDWQLDRSAAGYSLRLAGAVDGFDLSDAFRLIGRQRVGDMTAGPVSNELDIALACDCHAVPFTTEGGHLAVDIRDGQAPVAPIPEHAPPRPATALTPLARPAPFRDTPPIPQLGFLWRAQVAGRQGPLRNPPTAGSSGAETAPVHPHEDAIMADRPKVQIAEGELRHLLDRAAIQGLVEIDPRSKSDALASTEPPTATRSPEVSPASPAVEADRQLSIRAQTSVDRDRPAPVATAMRDPGTVCPPGSATDVPDWADDRPPYLQITERRARLVGEFDRPDPDAIEALARLYIALGLGDEARATLASFGMPDSSRSLLTELALVIDERPLPPEARLPGLLQCEGSAALWAFLATADPGQVDMEAGPLLLLFSALPQRLRDLLGPRLATRFLEGNDPNAARAVRDAMLRPGDGPARAALVSARIDLAIGRNTTGATELDKLALSNSAEAPAALVLAMDRRLQAGDPVPPVMVETAASYAYDARGTAMGGELLRVQILGLASNGDFATAKGILDGPAESIGAIQRHAAFTGFLDRLQANADDATFLELFFASKDGIVAGEDNLALRTRLADRLVDLGLVDLAESLGAAGVSGPPEGRRLAVRIALLRNDPDLALKAIGDETGGEWDPMRAQAEAMRGRHDLAGDSLVAAGDITAAAREYWRAGNWERIAQDGLENQKRDLAAMALLPVLAASAAPGPLAEGRSQIGQSQMLREAVRGLILSP